ncbi:MAG: glycosyltransferase family 9 protein [Symbiopectobacterium sp.]
MHMAAALATLTVCLFGPTDHDKWGRGRITILSYGRGDHTAMPERKHLDRNKKYLSCIPVQNVIHAATKLLVGDPTCVSLTFANYGRKIRNSA